MAGETVLLYNCSGPQWSKLRQVFVMQKLRMKAVEPGQYGLPLAPVSYTHLTLPTILLV